MSRDSKIPDIDNLPQSALLTYRQLALITGFSLSSVKRWAANGRGPHVTRIAGQPRFSVGAVKTWLEEANGQ